MISIKDDHRESRLLGQVLWRVVPLATLVLLGIWFSVALVSDRTFEAETKAKLTLRAKNQAYTTIARFENIVTTMRDLASNDLVVNGLVDPNADRSYLKPFFRSFAIEGFANVPILLTDYKARPITGKHIAEWSYAHLKRWNDTVSSGAPVLALYEQGLIVAVPVYIAKLVEGMLVIKLQPEHLRQILKPSAADGWVEIRGMDQAVGRQDMRGQGADTYEAIEVATRPLPYGDGLTLASAVFAAKASNHSTNFHRFMLVAFLLNLIALFIGILSAVLLVTKPLGRFIDHLDTLGRQNHPTPFKAERESFEIRQLGKAFNRFVTAEKELLREQSIQAERLAKALDREKELNGLQRQFVSLVSHEFRTPLAIIDGNAHRVKRMLDRGQPERIAQIVRTIRNSVTRLTDLMESVLSVSKLDEGRIRFEPKPCNIREMIKEVRDDYQQIYDKHNLVVAVENLPERAMVDVKLLRQVMSNLVSNAVKYSGDGTTVRIEGQENDDEVAIAVHDQGVGIPDEELGKLFERFFRASTSIGVAGTGIGLHLVKHVTELHGGRVEVTSKLDIGTTFTIYLPKLIEARGDDPTQSEQLKVA